MLVLCVHMSKYDCTFDYIGTFCRYHASFKPTCQVTVPYCLVSTLYNGVQRDTVLVSGCAQCCRVEYSTSVQCGTVGYSVVQSNCTVDLQKRTLIIKQMSINVKFRENQWILNSVVSIHPSELLIKDTTDSESSVSYLEILLERILQQNFRMNVITSISLLSIFRFLYLCSKIPSSHSYGIIVSQFIQYAMACSIIE